MHQRLHHRINVIVLPHVVQPYESRIVLLSIQIVRWSRVDSLDCLGRKSRVEKVLDVLQSRLVLFRYGIVVWQDVRLRRREVHEHMMRIVDAVQVGVRVATASLEVSPAYEARVDVDVGK